MPSIIVCAKLKLFFYFTFTIVKQKFSTSFTFPLNWFWDKLPPACIPTSYQPNVCLSLQPAGTSGWSPLLIVSISPDCIVFLIQLINLLMFSLKSFEAILQSFLSVPRSRSLHNTVDNQHIPRDGSQKAMWCLVARLLCPEPYRKGYRKYYLIRLSLSYFAYPWG